MGYVWGLSLDLWWMKTAGDCPRWLTKQLTIIILKAVKELVNCGYASMLYFWIRLICHRSLVTQRKGRLFSTRLLSFSRQPVALVGGLRAVGLLGCAAVFLSFYESGLCWPSGGASVYSVVCIPLENVGTTLHFISRGWHFRNRDTVRLTRNQVASLAG